MVALCKLASVMKVRELCVGAYFKTKHALDLSYTAVDTRWVKLSVYILNALINLLSNIIIALFDLPSFVLAILLCLSRDITD